MPLVNVHQLHAIGLNLRVRSGKEEDAFTYQPNKRITSNEKLRFICVKFARRETVKRKKVI